MRQRPLAQKTLFDDAPASASPPLPPQVRAEVMLLLVQWMQSVVQTINQEADDEQDHR